MQGIIVMLEERNIPIQLVNSTIVGAGGGGFSELQYDCQENCYYFYVEVVVWYEFEKGRTG